MASRSRRGTVGRYQLFLQAKPRGELITASFDVRIEGARSYSFYCALSGERPVATDDDITIRYPERPPESVTTREIQIRKADREAGDAPFLGRRGSDGLPHRPTGLVSSPGRDGLTIEKQSYGLLV